MAFSSLALNSSVGSDKYMGRGASPREDAGAPVKIMAPASKDPAACSSMSRREAARIVDVDNAVAVGVAMGAKAWDAPARRDNVKSCSFMVEELN